MNVRITKDFGAGVLFSGFGLIALFSAADFPMGTPSRMGPGAFPQLIALGLILIGIVVAARGVIVRGEAVRIGLFGPVLVVLAATLAFMLLLEGAGLVAAILALTAISAFSYSRRSLVETAAVFIVLTGLTVAIFVYGIGVDLKILPA